MEFQISEGIKRRAHRSDWTLIAGRSQVLEDRRHQLQSALDQFEQGSLPQALDVCIVTRALWMAIHALAQAYRPAFAGELLGQLREELQAAIDAIRRFETVHCTGVEQSFVAGLIRRSIQARFESLQVLATLRPLVEFEAAGVLLNHGADAAAENALRSRPNL